MRMSDMMDTPGARDGQKFVTAFARGLAVIEAFGPSRRRMNLAEVASLTRVDRAVARRLLHTLVELGFARVEGKQFELTSKVLQLGYTYLSSLGLDSRLQPYLDELSQAIGESVSVSVLDGAEVIFIARSEAPGSSIAYVVKTGMKLPALSSSSGRILLAARPDDEVEAMLDRVKIEARTSKTIVEPRQVLDIIRTARQSGYACNDQELELDLFGLSVPVRNQAGRVVASLNTNSQARRLTARRLKQELLPAMRDCAKAMSSVLL
jgi:IclR family transcriptional regulator, pca regulon regulatory protein